MATFMTGPTLMANWTQVALSMTLAKLHVEVVWTSGPAYACSVDVRSPLVIFGLLTPLM